ncbi:MAG: hypothetical protein HZA50_18685 [Planctomycetes bacterium]|nr:hypothetical protein [Planctomycetota bacterium]
MDHKWRDLPGLAALAVWLEEGFGLKTALIPYDQWQEGLFDNRPRAIVVSVLYGPRSRAIAQAAKKMGTRVIVIMTEGRPNNSQAMTYLVGRDSGADQADLWLTWSDTVRDFMIQSGVLPGEKLITAGAARFDFYSPPLRSLVRPRKRMAGEFGLDASKPVATWATNFTHAKFHRQNLDFMIKDWTALGVIRQPAYSNPAEFARLDWETRLKCFDAVRGLLAARGQLQLMVKPHPAEEHDVYADFVEKCRVEFGPRVVFVGSCYIWDVLNSSDVHIHRMCTTGVEAWLLGVPSIDLHMADYYAWSRELGGSAAESMDGNDVVTRGEDLIERVDYCLGGGGPSRQQLDARQRYIARWLFKVDGDRCREHAKILAEFLGRGGRVGEFPFDGITVRRRIRWKINRFLGRSAGRPLLPGRGDGPAKVDWIGQVDKIVSQEDIDGWLGRVRPLVKGSI